MSTNKFSSAYKIFKLTLEITGERAGNFKKSLIYFTIAFIAQGIAFGMFYPLLMSLFKDDFVINEVFTYLGIMILFKQGTYIFTNGKDVAFIFEFETLLDNTIEIRSEQEFCLECNFGKDEFRFDIEYPYPCALRFRLNKQPA